MGLILRTNHTNIPEGATVSNKLLTVEQIDNNFIFLQGLSQIETITKTVLDNLISTNSLKKGKHYRIKSVDSSFNPDYVYNLYGGTDIIVTAIETNKISNSGIGQFFNPKYNRNVNGYGIWDSYNTFDITLTNDTSNFFGRNEYITSYPNGYSGQIIGNIHSHKFISFGDDWTTEFAFSGNNSESTADINSVTMKTYSIGDVVFWGGRAWVNKSGNVGLSNNEFEFIHTGTSSKTYYDWNPISYTNSTYYNEVWDDIIYDYENDTIIERKDKANNIVRTSKSNNDLIWDYYSRASPIKAFQWGNEYVYNGDGLGVGCNLVESSYCSNINFMGYNFTYNNFINQSFLLVNSSPTSRMYINTYFNNNIFNGSYYYSNFLSSSFYSNQIFNSGIYDNAILGEMGSNILNNGGISNNSLYNGSVSYNEIINWTFNYNIQYYGNITNNRLKNSYIDNNIIINNIIQYNTLSDDSSIENIYSFGYSYNNYIRYNNLILGSYISNISFNNHANNNFIQYNNLSSQSFINSNFFQNYSNSNFIQNNNLTSESYIQNISCNTDTAYGNSIQDNNLTSESYINGISYNYNCNYNYIKNNNLHSVSYISNVTYNGDYSPCYNNFIQYNFMISCSYIYNIEYQSVINNSIISYNNLTSQDYIRDITYD